MLSVIHNYTNGYVVVPVLLACRRAGLFELLNRMEPVPTDRLVRELSANAGHLRVALLMIESMGWIVRCSGDSYVLTAAADRVGRIPAQAESLMSISMASYLAGDESVSLASHIALSHSRWGVDDPDLAQMLDGVIVSPLLSEIARRGGVNDTSSLAGLWSNLGRNNLHVPEYVREELAGLFFRQGWLTENTTTADFTAQGSFVFARTFLFAIVGSYWPMLQKLDGVIFGDCDAVFARDSQGREGHVDRALNVSGSGQQHTKYFRAMEEFIIQIFDTEPLQTQPRYIADTGCGDGSLLRRVYDTIRHRTLRGKHLDRFPLQLIGVDLNDEALEATRDTLREIDHRTIKGNISDPQKLIEDLKRVGIPDPGDILHIRSFLDHDRSFVPPDGDAPALFREERIASEYAFVDSRGSEIPAGEVYHNLVEHLERWASALGRHPLIILEVHCLEPAAVRRYLSQCESLHFDAYQRFSQQLLMRANHFLLAAAEAGLFARPNRIQKYPRTLGFTRITLASFEKRAYRIRWAGPNDLPRLLELEAECWEPLLRTTADVLRERIDRYAEGQLVLEIQDRIVGVIYSQRINDIANLTNATSDTVDGLHTTDGTVVQLLGLCITPDSQHSKLGDQLLEFALQYHELSNNITEIVGVTRCRGYNRRADFSIQEYIDLKTEQGLSVDTVLRFHQVHGAAIDRPIAGYRMHDAESRGYGVLIRYDLNQRRQLGNNSGSEAQPRATTTVLAPSVEQCLRGLVSRIIDCKETLVSLEIPLMELGLDSFGLMELAIQIEHRFQLKLEPTFFFQHNTLAKVASWIAVRGEPITASVPSISSPEPATPVDSDAIAIVGMACRLPGGIRSPEELWEALISNQSLIAPMSEISWRWSFQGTPASPPMPHYVACVADIDQFDAAFFNISRAEAELMDPQQRILLELSWECVEAAGHDVRKLAGTDVGVFLGVSGSDYKTLQDRGHGPIDPHYAIATSTSVIPNRISYQLDFRGPSVQVDTACSSSLVAIHQAVESLKRSECCAALAGGINLICQPNNTASYYQAGMLAPDGKCKTFDADANGYVRGEGAVVFLLKRMERAIADGDHIYASIIGSAVNHGGRAAGFTAPNPEQQADVVRRAMRAARIQPNQVSFIEAHGTGTSLGDPVEISGLASAFSQSATPCVIGSIKTNLGHLEAAAGAAGLLKTVLCLNHHWIPANLHFRRLNPKICLEGTPFQIAIENVPWDTGDHENVRVAGVSSFGSGGTNAHVLVQQHSRANRSETNPPADFPCLILLSAKTLDGLRRREADLRNWLSGQHQLNLRDISGTLAVGRTHFDFRSSYVVTGIEELEAALSQPRAQANAGRLRTSPAMGKIARMLLDEALASVHGAPELHAENLRALGELYLLGCDVDWNRFFPNATFQRLRLPAYPFQRDSYWLSAPASASVSDRPSEWLCFAEEWKLAPIDPNVDWEQRLSCVVEEQLCLVYDDPNHADAFCALLGKLQGFGIPEEASPNRIRRVHYSALSDPSPEWLHPLPDTVFFLSSAPAGGSTSFDPSLSATSAVFHLSKALMLHAGNHRVRLFYAFEETPYPSRLESEALAGFLRSAMMENEHHTWKLIAVAGAQAELHQAILREWLAPASGQAIEVRHAGGERSIRALTQTRLPPAEAALSGFRHGGTYVIAGGLGPIGELLCHELARRYHATLLIFSRAPLDPVKQQKIATLRSIGGTVRYYSVDIADRTALANVFDQARMEVGQIHGVVHLARVVENAPIAAKGWHSFERAVRAKVLGTVLLDELTSQEPLEIFLLFSSVASQGIRGAGDYAYANAFQNAFARYRSELVKAGRRSGSTVAQCWGPWTVDTYLGDRRDETWKSAGYDSIAMNDAFELMNPSSEHGEPVLYLMRAVAPEALREHFGVTEIPARSGSQVEAAWEVLDASLRRFEQQQMRGKPPAVSDLVKVLADYDIEAMPRSLLDRADLLLFPRNAVLRSVEIESKLRVLIAEILKTQSDFASERTLQELGLDSISAMQLASRLEKELEIPMQPKWFLEFATVSLLAEHLAGQAPLVNGLQ
jgi:3-oxoacyl-(acyl-carrier-protein) synthase/acyl carrier protein/NAD(P)-dependent dehydrogenase (short-subunit alcohol dehydrogenase family)